MPPVSYDGRCVDIKTFELLCMWVSGLVPLGATLFSMIYGLRHFFKKGKPLCLQSITMAMASHALGSIYHMCQLLTTKSVLQGFTPAYLGRIGFFLFILTASYGQLDRIVDDGSPKMRRARITALIAPLLAVLLYVHNALIPDALVSTKVVYAIAWIPAVFCVYFTLKHAIIPDLDFGFIRAIKPYNICVLLLSFSELLCLTAWVDSHLIPMAVTALVFGVLCVCTMVFARKGVEKWTI